MSPLFRTILVATDFSPPSDAALAFAGRLAKEHGARLLALHIAELHGGLHEDTLIVPSGKGAPTDGTPVRAGDHVRAEAMRGLRLQLHRFVPADVPSEPVVLFGHPVECIAWHAPKLGADLVVVGTHGRRGLTRALLGSVAERTVRLCPVPVLTIRAPGDENALPVPDSHLDDESQG